MSENGLSNYPPPMAPPPPPPPVGGRQSRGWLVIFGGIVFAFLPIIVTLVASIFVRDAFNEGTSSFGVLPLLTILTLPIGGIIAIIGLVIEISNRGKRRR